MSTNAAIGMTMPDGTIKAVSLHCDIRLRIRPGVRVCRVRVDLGSERAQEAKGDELLDLRPVFVVCRGQS